MNWIDEIKFRWQNCRPSLPGELEPTEYGATIVFMTKPDETEPHLLLKRFRGLMGYGRAWTFRAALWDWTGPILIVVLYFSFLAFLFWIKIELRR